MKFGLVFFMVGFAFLADGPKLVAQESTLMPINVRFFDVPSDFFERFGFDVQWDETEVHRRCVVLSDIERFFLLSSSKTNGPHEKKKTSAPMQLVPGKWALFRTPAVVPNLGDSKARHIASREVGIKLDRVAGAANKIRIETCEIEYDRFVNSTSSFAIIEPRQVAMIPVRDHGFIDLWINDER